MILSFKDKDAEKLFKGERVSRLVNIESPTRRKLRYLNNARDLNDLRIPPNNKLEALKGDRKGQHSIRVNDQYRICFVWSEGNATQVEITDYH